MKKSIVTLAVLAGVVGFAASAQATTNLVSNGDFTTLTHGVGQIGYNTTATGWSTSNSGYNFVMASGTAGATGQDGAVALWDSSNGGSNTWNGAAAVAGQNFLAMDGDYQTEAVTQTINNLVVGKTYDLTFNYAFGQQSGFTGATTQNLTAKIGGTSWTSFNYAVASHGFSGWQNEDLKFTATSASETLSFLAYGNVQVPPFALLSNVSIASGTPEPMTWAMMILGVAGLGGLARRRRAYQLTAVA